MCKSVFFINFHSLKTVGKIICVIYVLCFSCFRVCSLLPYGHLLGKGWPLGSCCIFVTFSYGIRRQVWYLIVSIPDLCHLSYFKKSLKSPWILHKIVCMNLIFQENIQASSQDFGTYHIIKQWRRHSCRLTKSRLDFLHTWSTIWM